MDILLNKAHRNKYSRKPKKNEPKPLARFTTAGRLTTMQGGNRMAYQFAQRIMTLEASPLRENVKNMSLQQLFPLLTDFHRQKHFQWLH